MATPNNPAPVAPVKRDARKANSQTLYEWDIETTNKDGDVEDHNHSERCPVRALRDNETLVLVRDVAGRGMDRSWAYVASGRLPESFADAYGRVTAKVPKRFHAELSKIRGGAR